MLKKEDTKTTENINCLDTKLSSTIAILINLLVATKIMKEKGRKFSYHLAFRFLTVMKEFLIFN